MNSLISIVLPVFAVIGLGWIAQRRSWLGDGGGTALNAFVFRIALPPLLFLAMARTPFEAFAQWRFLAAYVLGTAGVWTLMWMLMPRLGVSGFQARWLTCLGATFSNAVYLALPLFETAFGALSTQPVVLIALMMNLLLVGGSLIVLQAASGEGTRAAIKETLNNPMLFAIGAGLLVSWFELPLGSGAERLLTLLAQAASPVALFALGVTLGVAGPGVKFGGSQWVLTGAKLLLHPLLVAGACWAVGADAVNAEAAVLVAAMPAGSLVHVVAARRGTLEVESAALILLSTAVSVVTLTVFLEVVL